MFLHLTRAYHKRMQRSKDKRYSVLQFYRDEVNRLFRLCCQVILCVMSWKAAELGESDDKVMSLYDWSVRAL